MADNTMRAVVLHEFGGPEMLRMERIARPEPLPTEVLVRVFAAGVNPVDWKTRAGSGMAGVLGKPPFVLGWDVSGVVEQVGFGVTTLAPGDEVYGMPWFPRQAGAYAEYVTAPARQFAKKPAKADHEQAAGVPLAALTAWQALTDTAGLVAGQRVLVHAAAGGVGHFAVQFAKHLGAYVIGTASAARQEWLSGIGADELIDYHTARFEEAVGDVDVVLDLVGGDTGVRSVQTLHPGGLLIAVPGGVSAELATAARRRGVAVTPFLVEPDGAALSRIAGLIDSDAVISEVDEVFPLADATEAHRRGERGRTKGKLVLRVGEA